MRAATFLVWTTLVVLGCKSKPTASGFGSEQEQRAATALEKAAAPRAAPQPPSPLQKIQQARSLAEAVSVAKPLMSDEANKVSAGAVLLATWGAQNMAWTDVGVATDETSHALVLKDPDEERAKRLCVTGSIVQISTAKLDVGRVFEGLLITPAMKIYNFAAVGSSGKLVERSPARFCGVVIGKYDYSNSAGGTGHAVQLVGMFDLPENRKAKAAIN